jgi:hypothetical protein
VMVEGVSSSAASLPPQALMARMPRVTKKAKLMTRMGERRADGEFMTVSVRELTDSPWC